MKKITSFLLLSNLVLFNHGSIKAREGTNIQTDQKTVAVKTIQTKQSSEKPHKLFNAKVKILSNGLRIVVVEQHLVPRVSVGVLYNVGTADDLPGNTGISHMLEHMFFHGSKKYPQIDKTVGALGGYINAYTGPDYTMYITDAPASGLHLLLDLEADRMAHFKLTDPVIFNNEKNAVFEERLHRIENVPLRLAIEDHLIKALSPQHPYGDDFLGLPHQIHGYTMEAVMQHYRTWYKPNNATLIVVGDVDAQNVFIEAQKLFGHIPSGKVPERKRVENMIQKDVFQDITYYSDQITSPKVEIYHPAPAYRTHSIKECMAFTLAMNILCDGAQAPLAFYFKNTKKMISSMTWDYLWRWDTSKLKDFILPPILDPMPIMIKGDFLSNVSEDTYIKCYKKRIEELLKTGFSQTDFERSKHSMKILLYKKADDHWDIREHFALLSSGFTIDDIENLGNTLSSITLEEVNKVFRDVFSQPILAIIRFCPKPTTK